MAVLGTFTAVTNTCLANGVNCVAHGLPTTPDWANYLPVGTGAAAPASVPLHLISRSNVAILFGNGNPGINAEFVAQFVHSIMR